MSLFRRSFSRKVPDCLLEISERIYVFDCCLSTTSIMTESEYKSYLQTVVASLQGYQPGASCMVFNFIQGDDNSLLSDILIEYDMTVVDYPQQYEGYPLLPLEMIHYFLRSGESWLSLEGNKNVILMHCERGGWPLLAFMLAALLLYNTKQFNEEHKTLEMVYKQAPNNQLYSILSLINPRASQLRYLRYISGRNSGSDWPPSDAPLVMDHIVLKNLPLFDGGKGCRPVIRVYSQDPSIKANRSRKLLFSSLMVDEPAWQYPKEECVFVKLEIHCHVEGDVFIECVHLYDDLITEDMIFKVMFHTGFIESNTLVLNSDEIDVPWDAKYKLSKDFKTEIFFRDINEVPLNITMEFGDGDQESHDSEGEFFEVEEIFTPNSDSQEKNEDIDTILVQENNMDDDFVISVQETILNDHDSKKKDCTLHDGVPRWGSEVEDDDNLSESKEIFDDLKNDSPVSEAESNITASNNILVVDESKPKDVEVEIHTKPPSTSVAKSKEKKNKWQEITAKTIKQQRVISQWVPRSKAQVTEPTKPKTPVYKWVPKGPTAPKDS